MLRKVIFLLALAVISINQDSYCELIKERVYVNGDSTSIFDVANDKMVMYILARLLMEY